jgi:hypothetical protein
MDFIVAAGAATAVAGITTVTGEILLSQVVRKCLMYKMSSMSDQMCSLMWNLAQMGFVSAVRNVDFNENDNKSMAKLIAGREKEIPLTLIQRKEYEELRRSDLAGSVAFVYRVMKDKQRILKHQHCKVHSGATDTVVSDSNSETAINEPIADYFKTNTRTDNQGNEWKCFSPFCTESFQEVFAQLEESASFICQQIAQIRMEHAKYAKYYKLQKWAYGLNDEVYWLRLKTELPILEKRIQRFLTAIPWCTLIAQESLKTETT